MIEGNITDLTGPYIVKISESVNFDVTNIFPPVNGAKVIISDNAGNSETLKETIIRHLYKQHFAGSAGKDLHT